MADFTAPFSREYERLLLGTILYAADAGHGLDDAMAAASRIEPSDLYYGGHQHLLELLQGWYLSGQPLTTTRLAEHLMRTNTGHSVGGLAYCIELHEHAAPSVSSLGFYVGELLTLSRKRAAMRAAYEVLEATQDPNADIAEVMAKAQRSLQDAQHRDDLLSTWSGKAVGLFRQEREREQLAKAEGRVGGVRTGLVTLDENLIFGKGGLTVLHGNSGHGKSGVAQGIGIDNAAAGLAGAFYSMEMTRAELSGREIARLAGVSLKRAIKGQLNAEEQHRWDRAEDQIEKRDLPLAYVADYGLTIDKLMLHATQLDRRLRANGFDDGLSFVVIDYLQKVNDSEQHRNREQAVAAISRKMKLLAGDIDTHVFALAQSKRKGAQVTNQRPQRDDLRESGAIEQDADNILAVFWEAHVSDPSEKAAWWHCYEVEAQKARNGTECRQLCHWQPSYGLLRNADDDELAAHRALLKAKYTPNR